jgi:hypothetical protein
MSRAFPSATAWAPPEIRPCRRLEPGPPDEYFRFRLRRSDGALAGRAGEAGDEAADPGDATVEEEEQGGRDQSIIYQTAACRKPCPALFPPLRHGHRRRSGRAAGRRGR